MRTALYRHFDADGQLLYVGITHSPAKRNLQHSKKSNWFGEVAQSNVEWFSSRGDAEAEERRVIRAEKPVHNSDFKAPATADHVYLCPEIGEFANDVLAFGDKFGFKPSTILQKSCLNGKSWPRIITGYDITVGTVSKVRAWMDAYAKTQAAQ